MSDSILDSVQDVSGGADQPPVTAPQPMPMPPKESARTLTIAVTVVLVLIILFYVLGPRGLGHRLAKSGWVLFVRDGCGYCTKQMKILGGSYPSLVECTSGGKLASSYCDNPPFACSQITGFPSWYHTGSKVTKSGLQSKSNLEDMCDN